MNYVCIQGKPYKQQEMMKAFVLMSENHRKKRKNDAKYAGVQNVAIQNTRKEKENQSQQIWMNMKLLSCCFVPPTTVLPEELGSWWTQLQDATDEALALI